MSGMHGDEYEVVGCVKQYLKDHKRSNYFYIPEVSPSAVAHKTRMNAFGRDVNREFFDPPRDPEVQTLMNKILPYRFDLCLDFHEDPDREKSSYLYDTGNVSSEQLSQLQNAILGTGALLYHGIDDPWDAHLGFHINRGYISIPLENLPKDAGFASVWCTSHAVTKRFITVEIPGKAPITLKQKLVGAIFDTIVPRDVAQLASARRLGR